MSTDNDLTIRGKPMKFEQKITIPINVEFSIEQGIDGSFKANYKINPPENLSQRLEDDIKKYAIDHKVSFQQAINDLGFIKVESKLVLV